PLNDPALFTPSALTQVAPGNGGEFQLTAKRSQLYFNAVALPGTKNQVGVYIGIYFAGNNYSVILNNAYLKYRGFTVGYKFTMYCDMASSPNTIDSEGPNSSPSIRNTVINYEHNFSPKIKAGIGLELPMTSITTTNNTIIEKPITTDIISRVANVNQRIPDIPLYLQYKWNTTGNGHVRLSGMLRNMQYRNINHNENENSFGWGVKLSGLAQYGAFTTYFMAQYGKGIASYLQDNTGMGLDMVPCSRCEGYLANTKSWGAYGGIQYNFSKKLFLSAVYSHVRNYMHNYNGGAMEYANQYQWGQYALGNIMWNITPNVQTGLEYVYGRRMSMDNTQIHDNRISAMMQVSF
ncbi:MAG: porin, partial [Muribaculaceae bacterium]